ncbi:hypothetical protein LPC08_18495 [Roseomonas sp. OT10]|uniref:glycoside hydrolase family 65 protein n=1 Tax=Roseomonas cutis TaxID=2897332 RepID=UPI001E4D4899|nr:glycosyl hydrolase family 65 protein [Roseomonas sp. OT10]UFN47986.1 hypothetical protein LPC08_18495 [Roseomonas sp. OT10]
MLRARFRPPADIFPVDPWRLDSRAFAQEFTEEAETIFALSNGYLGLRGSHEEGHPVREPGTYLNGFFEYRKIVYGETAYGFPDRGQTMLDCPDGKILQLFVDGDPLVLGRQETLRYRRCLDMRRAVLERDIVWATPNGKHVRLTTRRLVSLTHRHLACIHMEVVSEDADADLMIVSELRNAGPPVERDDGVEDPRAGHAFEAHVLRPAGQRPLETGGILSFSTAWSRQTVACGIDHVLDTECHNSVEVSADEEMVRVEYRIHACPGLPIRLTKYMGYHFDDRRAPEELRDQVSWTLRDAKEAGFEAIAAGQAEAAAAFWATSDVEIRGDARKQQVIRWNLFQLLQASRRVDGAGIAARGLTGRAYEGHYFWDTEIYILPFLTYTAPRIARSLLRRRHQQLPQARARAKELGHRGALYPWRTIDGNEASAYFAASTAQYHINADIIYAMRKYVEVSGDEDFLRRYGAEMLVETARLWVTLGWYNPRRGGAFVINGVTGPDEYAALVDNNYFTNLMARENLAYAASVLRRFQAQEPEAWRTVVRRTELHVAEIEEWERAASAMCLPYDETLRIHPQDDSFLDKQPWDFAHTPREKYPLLLHFHPLNLYRHQVIKQADVLLAMFLLGQQFTRDHKRRNFDFYDPRTTHDSSLSVCIQSIVASEIGYAERAMDYFDNAATMDLSDIGGNVKHGAHLAAIGGTWLALVYGFGGLTDHGGRIAFSPRLPARWKGMTFHLCIRGTRLRAAMTAAETCYELLDGGPLEIEHAGEALRLEPEAGPVTRPNPPPAAE